jgi:hypothetical protein
MITPQKKKRIIQSVMRRFDFEQAQSVLQYMGVIWDQLHTPTIRELQTIAVELLDSVITRSTQNGSVRKPIYACRFGLRAEADFHTGCVELFFTPINASVHTNKKRKAIAPAPVQGSVPTPDDGWV